MAFAFVGGVPLSGWHHQHVRIINAAPYVFLSILEQNELGPCRLIRGFDEGKTPI